MSFFIFLHDFGLHCWVLFKLEENRPHPGRVFLASVVLGVELAETADPLPLVSRNRLVALLDKLTLTLPGNKAAQGGDTHGHKNTH